jgi:hypothetical protein
VDGRTLTFRLFGINNQNFIMRDEETGSWWQQVSGEALHGPLKGRRLKPVLHDEISFAVFRAERPRGRVLRPLAKHAGDYEDWNWEKQMKKVPTVRGKDKDDPFEPRAVVVGVRIGETARAYPFPLLRRQSPVVDRLGGEPIVIVVGDDKKSVRVFKTTVDGRELTFARRAGVRPLQLVDAETASEWDFSGRAVAGPLLGQRLEKVRALKEYWFDWKTYNPQTGAYAAGEREARAADGGTSSSAAGQHTSGLDSPAPRATPTEVR